MIKLSNRVGTRGSDPAEGAGS